MKEKFKTKHKPKRKPETFDTRKPEQQKLLYLAIFVICNGKTFL